MTGAVSQQTLPRRARTRERICAAARDVFETLGYGAATMERIAEAAQIGRTTLYSHFSDKDEILGAIADDYLTKLVPVIHSLPGPRPSRRQIDAWLAMFATFAEHERAPTRVLIHFSVAIDAPRVTEGFGDRVMQAFASRIPAFEAALDRKDPLAWARASAVLREISWALTHHVEEKGAGCAPAMLEVAGDLLEQLIKGWF